jgi:tetratricopeptide (TPR) repeat protein/DNA-binding CsgD family transcriptional regulator
MNLKIGLHFVIITFTILQGVVSAQSSVKEINNNINKIESYLYQNPNQGKTDLMLLLKNNPAAPDSTKGYIYIKLTTAFGMINQLDSGLWAANLSIKFFNDRLEKGHALKMKAVLYRIKGEYQPAEATLKEALLLNDSIWKNQVLKAVLLQEYASLNNDQNKFYSATQLYLKALETVNAPDYKDPNFIFNRLKIQVNLAEAYSKSGNHDFAIRLFDEVLPKLDSLKDYDGYIRSGYQLAESYIQTKQYAEAEKLVNKLLPMTEALKNEELRSYIILIQGMSRSHQKKYAEAIPYYRQSFGLMGKNQSAFILDCAIPYLTALKNTNGQEEAHKIINNPLLQTALASAMKSTLLNFKKVAVHFTWNKLSPTQLNAYYQDLLKLSELVNSESQKQEALDLQAKYQFEEQEKNTKGLTRENALLRNSEDYKRKQIYLIIIIASLLITTILLSAMRIRQRSIIQAKELEVQKKEIEIHLQQSEIAEQEKNNREHLLEQQRLLLTQTLSDSEDLKIKMNQMVEEQGLEQRKELLEQFVKFKEEELGLDKLLIQFNNIHPSFNSSLLKSYQKLSHSDLQFCMLYRMNMSTKDIAALLQIEPRSIYAKKYRIMEKMGLGGEDDFDQIIFNVA